MKQSIGSNVETLYKIKKDKAEALASELPHIRESREIIQPLISQNLDDGEIDSNIRSVLLGE